MHTTRPREFTGKHMLLVTCAFFGVIIAVNVFMAVSSARTWTGLVVANSYVASQEFQVKADAAHAQNEAGWTMHVGYKDGQLVVLLRDGEGPLDLDGVSAFVRRPVGGHDDVAVPLARSGDAYRGPVGLTSGVWDITVTTADTALGAIERETRISVP
ncbi:MAG: FixH family protein [Candidatus Devosia phytovorans]|uniref:FixH family protein n=1 Tax=Candidatus Devosia phytovorans TaxID=3121372 RepID=A0AAJ6B1D0_9HYPH|nr:FixH family protein [Devosia sp.]WEK06665.1 MAG: FixH family protein [Devosia sp.]